MSAAVPVSEMGMVITMQESSPAPRGSLPELCTFGAIALADMIRRRKVSAEEVMATYLDHIGRTNPAVNAIISLRPRDELLAEAREADDAVARGKVLGPLHGVPQAIKDLALTRGLLTTFGSHLFADFVHADLLAVAALYEKLCPWLDRLPALIGGHAASAAVAKRFVT